MSESATTSIKISESEHQSKIDELMEIREKPIFEKIQWILGTTSIRDTQSLYTVKLYKMEKELTSEKRFSFWFAVFGIALTIGFYLTSRNDATLMELIPILVVILVVTLAPSLALTSNIRTHKKAITKMKKDGIYTDIQKTINAQPNTRQFYAFHNFKDCINNGRPISAGDNTIDFNDVLFIEKIDKQISENLLLN